MPARTDSSERPSERPSAPPILVLGGNKPSWRDRQAQKEAEIGGNSSTPGPSLVPAVSRNEAPTTEPSKRSGYVPPQLRGDATRGRHDAQSSTIDREESSGGEKWRPRQKEVIRDGSPTDTAKYVPRLRQEGNSRGDANPRTESPASSAGKYVPRHLRDRQ